MRRISWDGTSKSLHDHENPVTHDHADRTPQHHFANLAPITGDGDGPAAFESVRPNAHKVELEEVQRLSRSHPDKSSIVW